MVGVPAIIIVFLASLAATEVRRQTTEPPIVIVEEANVRRQTTEPPIVIVEEAKESSANVDGEVVLDDMVLTKEQWRGLLERKAITNLAKRWPDGPNGTPLVPYMFITNPDLDIPTIRKGIQHWEENTCIRFEETTNFDQAHLRFNYGVGCNSYIGMVSSSGQIINISKNCNTTGIVAHEIGHAIGFFHEQSRTDRDDHVVIHYDNIATTPKDYTNNFVKCTGCDNYGVPYDYGSLMHYGSKGFSKNGSPTISTVNPLLNYRIGQRDALSFRDSQLANIIYNCIGKWQAICSITTSPCQNGGYIFADCKCRCPPGTSGTNCEIVTGDYYGDATDGCTEKVTSAGTVTSTYGPDRMCTKVIKAPACFLPQLKFTNFELYPEMECTGGAMCCRTNSLEIRNNYPSTTDPYCDTEITPGTIITGTSSQMVLSYDRTWGYKPGFTADLTFVPDPTCTTTTSTTTSTTTTTTTTSPTPTTTTTTFLPC